MSNISIREIDAFEEKVNEVHNKIQDLSKCDHVILDKEERNDCDHYNLKEKLKENERKLWWDHATQHLACKVKSSDIKFDSNEIATSSSQNGCKVKYQNTYEYYSKWDKWIPDDPVSKEELEHEQQKQLQEFEQSNSEFCSQFIQDVKNRNQEEHLKKQQAETLRVQSNAYYMKNQYQDALYGYQQVLKLTPLDTRITTNIAQVYIKLQVYEDALEFLNRTLYLEPLNIKAISRKAHVLSEQRQYIEAITILHCLLYPQKSTTTSDINYKIVTHETHGNTDKHLGKEGKGVCIEWTVSQRQEIYSQYYDLLLLYDENQYRQILTSLITYLSQYTYNDHISTISTSSEDLSDNNDSRQLKVTVTRYDINGDMITYHDTIDMIEWCNSVVTINSLLKESFLLLSTVGEFSSTTDAVLNNTYTDKNSNVMKIEASVFNLFKYIKDRRKNSTENTMEIQAAKIIQIIQSSPYIQVYLQQEYLAKTIIPHIVHLIELYIIYHDETQFMKLLSSSSLHSNNDDNNDNDNNNSSITYQDFITHIWYELFLWCKILYICCSRYHKPSILMIKSSDILTQLFSFLSVTMTNKYPISVDNMPNNNNNRQVNYVPSGQYDVLIDIMITIVTLLYTATGDTMLSDTKIQSIKECHDVNVFYHRILYETTDMISWKSNLYNSLNIPEILIKSTSYILQHIHSSHITSDISSLRTSNITTNISTNNSRLQLIRYSLDYVYLCNHILHQIFIYHLQTYMTTITLTKKSSATTTTTTNTTNANTNKAQSKKNDTKNDDTITPYLLTLYGYIIQFYSIYIHYYSPLEKQLSTLISTNCEESSILSSICLHYDIIRQSIILYKRMDSHNLLNNDVITTINTYENLHYFYSDIMMNKLLSAVLFYSKYDIYRHKFLEKYSINVIPLLSHTSTSTTSTITTTTADSSNDDTNGGKSNKSNVSKSFNTIELLLQSISSHPEHILNSLAILMNLASTPTIASITPSTSTADTKNAVTQQDLSQTIQQIKESILNAGYIATSMKYLHQVIEYDQNQFNLYSHDIDASSVSRTIKSVTTPNTTTTTTTTIGNNTLIEYDIIARYMGLLSKLSSINTAQIELKATTCYTLLCHRLQECTRIIDIMHTCTTTRNKQNQSISHIDVCLISNSINDIYHRYELHMNWITEERSYLITILASIKPLTSELMMIGMSYKIVDQFMSVFPSPRTELNEVTKKSVCLIPDTVPSPLLVGNAACGLLPYADIPTYLPYIFQNSNNSNKNDNNKLYVEKLICAMATCTDIRVRKNISILLAKGCRDSKVKDRVTELRGLEIIREINS